MKKARIIYWVVSILFAGFMIWSGLPGLKPSEESEAFMKGYLGFPNYFTQFISAAKIVGGIAILIPGLRTIKEWAYAGLFYDLAGAIFSVAAVAGPFNEGTAFISGVLLVGILSYLLWKKQVKAAGAV